MSSPRPPQSDLLGIELRRIRLEARVGLAELSRRLGISRQAVWLIERPTRHVTATAADRYLRALRQAVADRRSRTEAVLRGDAPESWA